MRVGAGVGVDIFPSYNPRLPVSKYHRPVFHAGRVPVYLYFKHTTYTHAHTQTHTHTSTHTNLSSSPPGSLSANTIDPSLTLDVFLFQSASNMLLSHFLSLICSLWLLSACVRGHTARVQVRVGTCIYLYTRVCGVTQQGCRCI